MNRAFDFYEYAGVLVPGAVLVMGLLWVFPEGRALLAKDGVTLGELGLFVIIAYAAGQLVQAIGNYSEWAWWKAWGIPSANVLGGKYVTEHQHRRILDAICVQGISCDPQHIDKLSRAQQLAIAREVYSVVAAGKRAGRVDTLSGT